MPPPANIAAIDAGSNAIRLLIARVENGGRVSKLERKRSAVRLGHGAFTRHELDEATIAHAVQTFTNFRYLMERRRVGLYRAVATSATRNAANRRILIERIFERTGLELEVIDGGEEARLVRTAVFDILGPRFAPRLILDLGGGSLELNFLRGRTLEESLTLPMGTVRLLESLNLDGAISEDDARRVTERVYSVLEDRLARRPLPGDALAVACGGNAETLAQIAPGDQTHGLHTLDLESLTKVLPRMLAMDVPRRRKIYEVRRDRAEVMGIAALVLCRLGERLNLRQLLVPGVGVREGLVRELAETHIRRHTGLPSSACT